MHKRAFQGLKTTFNHVSGLPPPYFDFKKANMLQISFFIKKNMAEKTSDMHKRTFQALKRTFMHVSGLLPAYFDLKKVITNYLVILSKDGGGRPETCINVRFRA